MYYQSFNCWNTHEAQIGFESTQFMEKYVNHSKTHCLSNIRYNKAHGKTAARLENIQLCNCCLYEPEIGKL